MMRLYSGRILALAADIPHLGRLQNPDASVKKRSAVCGSTVTVDVKLDNSGRLAALGLDVKACALGQAAASVVSRGAVGCDLLCLQQAKAQLHAMLKDNQPAPHPPFEALDTLRPAAAFRNRHDSILLAITAICEAVEEAQTP